jgi:hypothetical protein
VSSGPQSTPQSSSSTLAANKREKSSQSLASSASSCDEGSEDAGPLFKPGELGLLASGSPPACTPTMSPGSPVLSHVSSPISGGRSHSGTHRGSAGAILPSFTLSRMHSVRSINSYDSLPVADGAGHGLSYLYSGSAAQSSSNSGATSPVDSLPGGSRPGSGAVSRAQSPHEPQLSFESPRCDSGGVVSPINPGCPRAVTPPRPASHANPVAPAVSGTESAALPDFSHDFGDPPVSMTAGVHVSRLSELWGAGVTEDVLPLRPRVVSDLSMLQHSHSVLDAIGSRPNSWPVRGTSDALSAPVRDFVPPFAVCSSF